MAKNKLVCVHWRDITTLDSAWLSTEQAIVEGREKYNLVYKTVGYLIENNKDFVLVAATYDADGDEYNDISMIMKCVIIKTETLNAT